MNDRSLQMQAISEIWQPVEPMLEIAACTCIGQEIRTLSEM